MKRISSLQVILKVVERCNLACSYCYYFEGGDRSFISKPPVISSKVINDLAVFLRRGAEELGLASIQIAFHGGEPMMLKPRIFDEICTLLRAEVNASTEVHFSVQTNGTHLNDTWCELFQKHDVHVGVSIDGMEIAQNRFRKFHDGRGSFGVVKENFKILKKSQESFGRIPDIICVLDARNNYREIIHEMSQDLGVKHFNFLLPDCNHDDGVPGGFTAVNYGEVLCEIFDAWAESGDIYVREIDDLIRRFQLAIEVDQPASRAPGIPKMLYGANQIVVVRSDGELQIDDTFIPASDWRNSLPKVGLDRTTLVDYLSLPVFAEIEGYYKDPPDKCSSCVWRNICNGGDLENRYSRKDGFNNPSIYCDGLKMLYRRIVRFLRRNGYPREVMYDRLKPASAKKSIFAR